MQKYSELLRELFHKRGIRNEEEAEIFLNPDYKRDLYNPFLMRDMERACVRLYEAIEHKEKIIIYADYDCDGVPGAVILTDLFKLINYFNFEVYIPERNSEGYGLNMEAIAGFKESKVKLIITVDLGITAVAEVAQTAVEGIDVIITDHHIPPKTLPKAYAILNPKVDDPDAPVGTGYPEKMLCGAGVVFKFVQGFLKKYGEYYNVRTGAEKWMLDMAGLATLSDMVPLLGENRAIATFGLKVLRKSPRPGLQKLLSNMKVDQKNITEDDVGFMLTPRLNAASRMGSPRSAYEVLATEDIARAGAIAEHLSEINDERKNIVVTIMREVNRTFEKRKVKEVIVVGNPKWRVGVLGLVAAKIADEHGKPVFVWGKDENDCIRGSCRSGGAVSVVELMSTTSEYFREFGGHEGAGGFTAVAEKIHFLEDALSSSSVKLLKKKKIKHDLNNDTYHDMQLGLGDVNRKNWAEISRLAPFGLGNEKPLFLFQGVKIEKVRKFGKNGSGEHLEILVSDGTGKAKAVSFFATPESFKAPLVEGKSVDLYATFDLSRWGGREDLRLRITDVI